MIKSKQLILVAAAAVMLQAGVALAQDSLEGLLAEVQAARAAEQQAFQQRAAELNAAPAEQQAKMLAEAQSRREALSAASDKLAEQFSANELVINEADKKLRDKAASLGLPLAIVRDSRADGRKHYGVGLILVRPDQFVAWAGEASEINAHAILRRVAGFNSGSGFMKLPTALKE